MDYFKKIERSVTISADKRSTVDLQVDVWSQDLNVTKFILKLDTTDSAAIDLTNATVRVAMVYSQDGKDVKIEAAGIVEDVATQKIAYVMDDKLAGFEGLVIAGFYVTLNTGQRIDIQNVTFNMRKSLLDKDLEAATDNYYQTFDDIVADVQSEGEKAKTQINQVLPDVQAEGEKVKTSINAVVADVNSYTDSQKQIINNFVTDVQTTGEKAKTDINAVLPSVQAEISELKTEIENLPDIPDLFVAYADDLSGNGFSKTDSSKLYKGFSVKNSNLPSDYRWERNVNNFQIGGRNLWIISKMIGGIKETLPDNHITGQKECWRINNGGSVTFKIEPEFSKRMYGKTFTFSAWVKWENVVQGSNIFNAFNIFKQATKYKNSSTDAESSTYYPSPGIKKGTSDWVKLSYTYTYNQSGYDMLKTSIFFNIDGAQSGTAWITGIKVEEGNNATDWSPSPEDVPLLSSPINSILTTLSAENPSTTLGGTWTQLGTETKFEQTIYYWKRTN